MSHVQPREQQNAHAERYNLAVRHEYVDQDIIVSIEEAQDFAT